MTMMSYGYKDPADMKAFKLIREGEGLFKILDIVHGYSKKGKEQFVFTFKLKDVEGNTTLYKDYMQVNEYMAENIYRICEAVGRPDLYTQQGTNPEDLKGLTGKCKIATEQSQDPQYDDKSVIARFIAYQPMREEAELDTKSADIDDDIPF